MALPAAVVTIQLSEIFQRETAGPTDLFIFAECSLMKHRCDIRTHKDTEKLDGRQRVGVLDDRRRP